MTAEELRKQMTEARQALSPEAREAAAQSFTERLCALPEWLRADTVALFLSFGSELDTRSVIETAFSEGKQVLLPICQKDYHMIFSVYTPTTPLITTGMGLEEIAPEAIQEVPPENIDFCLVPGLVFDDTGARIGYGAGFYDRFLPRLSEDTAIIGAGYDCQVIKNSPIPQKDTDVRLPMIVTEEGIYRSTKTL